MKNVTYLFLQKCFQFIYSLSNLCSQFHFQLGSSFSLYGCLYKHNEFGGSTVNRASSDAELGPCMVSTLDGALHIHDLPKSQETAGVWGYIFQIIYQVVLLNDSIAV